MKKHILGSCVLVALALPASPGTGQERLPPPLVEEYPTKSATIKATYSCEDVYSIEIELQKRDEIVTVQSLKTMGRTLSEADRKHVNSLLMKLRDFSAHTVYCAEGGMILMVHGTARSERKNSSVSIWWGEKGVRDLDFE